jgi:biotin synthase
MTLRHDWTTEEINALFERPLMDLLFDAQTIHRQHFAPNQVQRSTLLSIKTGSCPEDCSYCPQSAHYNTELKKEKLFDLEDVLAKAKTAKANGATRFCMGAAWRKPPKKEMPQVAEMIREVKAMGLETCVTLGMLDDDDVEKLKSAGLDYYNHNLDTSPEYYEKIISTRSYQDRLDTLTRVRNSGINVCCGGIVGMGEAREDRVKFLQQVANLPEHPQSVPINRLVKVEGTPLQNTEDMDNFEFIRTLAIARILMPKSMVRLSAGRETMNAEMQALCFMAGANSIFYGEKLLTTPNPDTDQDLALFKKMGIVDMAMETA